MACSQLEPILEKKASAALSAILVQLEPFLKDHPPLPPEPAAKMGVSLVDWGTYPPARLLRALVQNRPQRVAGIVRKISTQRIPLDVLGTWVKLMGYKGEKMSAMDKCCRSLFDTWFLVFSLGFRV